MSAFNDAGEARVLAFEGGQQVARALAAEVRRMVRNALHSLGLQRDVTWEA